MSKAQPQRARQPQRSTQTEREPRVATERSLSAAGLSAQEEQVVRMVQGWTLAPDAALELQPLPDAEVRAQVALYQAQALAHQRDTAAIRDELVRGLREP